MIKETGSELREKLWPKQSPQPQQSRETKAELCFSVTDYKKYFQE